jgi:EAL domain-containing protein (putative c-di-GMP-specific phosphodiesterase class I)
MVKKMKCLKDMGFFLSIDDFGTGYSSLSYLKTLPLSKLKIDQSFIRDIQHDKNDRAIVETIISMAKHLDLDVLAEGVETKEQLQFLVEKGCYKYQGFYFSKPLMPDDFYELWVKPQMAAQRAGSLGRPGERPPKH